MSKKLPVSIVLKAIDKFSKPVANATKNMNKITGPIRSATRSFKPLQKATVITKRKMRLLGQTKPFKVMSASINKVTAQIRQMNNAYYLTKLRIGEATRSLRRFGHRAKNIGTKASIGLTLPVGLFGASTIKTAANFELAMNKVQALSGATNNQFKALQEQAKKLGSTTQFSASQAADAMGFLAMAGFKTNQILGALPGTLELAASAQMDLGESADIVSNILTGYKLEVKELSRVNDVLVKTFTSSNVNLQMLGESFKKVAPVASSMGIKLEETAAVIGTLGNAGIQAEEAGTAVRNMLISLAKPTTEAKEVLSKLGIPKDNIIDSKGNVKSLITVIKEFENAEANASDLASVFGKRAGPVFGALIGQGAKSVKDLKNQLLNSTGTANRIAQAQMKGAMGAIKTFKSALEGLQISIASSGLLEVFTNITKKISSFIQGLSKSSPEMLKWGTIIGTVAIALGPMLAAIGFMATGIGSLMPVIGGIAAMFTVLISPIGAVAALIAGLGTGAYVLISRWSKVSKFFTSLWKGIKSEFNDGVAIINDKITGTIELASNYITSTIAKIKKLFNTTVSSITSKFKTLSSYLPDFLKKKIGFNIEASSNIKQATGIKPAGPVGATKIIKNNLTNQTTKRIEKGASLKVSFENMPKGVRVQEGKNEGVPLDLSLGYTMVTP